jgi:uncharacterized membrane protein YphA (DoxX/SURF4 family)
MSKSPGEWRVPRRHLPSPADSNELSDKESKMSETKIQQAWFALKTVFSVVPIAAGADKFFNLLTNWEQYLSPLARSVLPVGGGTFMRIAGIVEIVVGIMILTKWTRIGAYVATGWLTAIALNLLLSGHYLDVAVRDLAMAVGAFALGRLEEAHASAREANRDRHVQALESVVHG